MSLFSAALAVYIIVFCEGGSRIADLESGRVRDVHASTVNPI